MDIVDILFNKKPITISGGTSNMRFTRSFQPEPAERLLRSDRELLEDDVEHVRQKLQRSTTASNQIIENYEDNVYTKYKFDRRSAAAQTLPVHDSKDQILQKIAQFPSVVIEGSTGCGKSTQIPQMILDEARANNQPCNIIVTQPRRIAARSIAERVCSERFWELGSLVGYQIGLDKRFVSEDTRILFCTTGILLEKLIQMKTMSQFTHIILDEIHERDKDMDFLFIIIRMLLAKEATNVKIILMSATIDTKRFSEYFSFNHYRTLVPAPVIKIDKRLYDVKVFYLDDFDGRQVPTQRFDQPGISDEMYKLALSLIIGYKPAPGSSDASSVLIFLPGIYEIGRMRTALTDYVASTKVLWQIYILHSLISSEEQQSIFKRPENGARKIILSTNIAESSITVPDVQLVIDFCLMKFLKADTSKNFTSLEIDWASKNNCVQRAGRAGRVADGRCFRLISRKLFDCYMKDSPTPELLLTPLENIILKAKTFEMEQPHVILGLAMDPPDLLDIANSVLTLKELGGLHMTLEENEYCTIDGRLTFLGRIMASLPVDIRATRLMAIGYCYGVLHESIIMAAGLTTKSIFQMTFEKNLREYTRRLEWSNGSGSDLIAMLHAYRIWKMKQDVHAADEREFCKKHCLDVRSLHECHNLVQELTKRLDHLGIRQLNGPDRIRWTEQEKSIILKLVIAGAFYPNFFTTPSISNPAAEREAFNVLNGRDPDNTVFFTGFRQEHIRELYVQPIRNLFCNTVVDEKDIDCVKVSFDANSEKVFVTFDMCKKMTTTQRADWNTKQCSIPGKSLAEVYKAIKYRKMNMNSRIPLMKHANERAIAEELGLGFHNGHRFERKQRIVDDIEKLCVPNALQTKVDGTITFIEHCSKFWFQPHNERERVQRYFTELNTNFLDFVEPCTDFIELTHDLIIVARDHKDNKLYRARFVKSEGHQNERGFVVTVCFMDYGRTQNCGMNDLFTFIKDTEQAKMPARCFPCRLAEIQPSAGNISGGHFWDQHAVNYFQEFVNKRTVTAEIYSVVTGLANVFIMANGVNANDGLLKSGYGDFCEENFLSKNNHWKRQQTQNCVNDGATDVREFQYADCEEYIPIAYAEPFKVKEQRFIESTVQLRGPRSPLESQVYSALANSSKNCVSIDQHSVNSVLLSSSQQDLSTKYMVAAHISQQGSAQKELIMHETTLLPGIRGFGPLMAMIFCPNMDLKRDQWGTRYVSVRTGLGYNVDYECPYFEEHDAIFSLDFEFTDEDLEIINFMRYSFNTLLYSEKNQIADGVSVKNKSEMMKKLKDSTIKLLTKERTPMEINTATHEWQTRGNHAIKLPKDMYGNRSVFPVLGAPLLRPMAEEDKLMLRRHCHELRSMTFAFTRSIMCELCATVIDNADILRNHLMTRLHIDREKQIEFDPLTD